MKAIVHCAYDKHSGTVFCLYSVHVTDRIKKSKYRGIQKLWQYRSSYYRQ